jgi:hypothetical protein
MCCLRQLWSMSFRASSAVSRYAIIQPTTERLKTSRMTYRQQEVHLAGRRSFMMSQLQSRLGDVASSSGFA